MADDHKPGPDTSYTPEIGARICELLAEEGKSMHEICRMEGSPSRRAIYNWLHSVPAFKEAHDEARKIQRFFLEDEFRELGDRVNESNYRSMKVKIESKQWLAACIQPDVFSQKARLEHSGPDGKPIEAAIHVTFVRPDNGDSGQG